MKRFLLLCMCFMLVLGCATVPLTEEQKAQSTISKVQGQLNVWFDGAKLYYDQHPEKKGEWKGKVVPAFDLANNTLHKLIEAYANGDTSLGKLAEQMATLQEELKFLLVGLGVLE